MSKDTKNCSTGNQGDCYSEDNHGDVSDMAIFMAANIGGALTNEQELWLAALRDALLTVGILKQGREHRQIPYSEWHEEQQWFIDPEQQYDGSFTFICEALKLSPSYLRKRLMEFECEGCGVKPLAYPCLCINVDEPLE